MRVLVFRKTWSFIHVCTKLTTSYVRVWLRNPNAESNRPARLSEYYKYITTFRVHAVDRSVLISLRRRESSPRKKKKKRRKEKNKKRINNTRGTRAESFRADVRGDKVTPGEIEIFVWPWTTCAYLAAARTADHDNNIF